MDIRIMTMDDYEQVSRLWQQIKGFGIRTLDDSKEGVERFLRRNPSTSVVALEAGRVVGAILCGHDGRCGCMYHVCVAEACRDRGIGRRMAFRAMKALKAEGICKVSLIAFKSNDGGNRFWKNAGWTLREDLNYYEFPLNAGNLTEFVD